VDLVWQPELIVSAIYPEIQPAAKYSCNRCSRRLFRNHGYPGQGGDDYSPPVAREGIVHCALPVRPACRIQHQPGATNRL
jgi:hypothetical protein